MTSDQRDSAKLENMKLQSTEDNTHNLARTESLDSDNDLENLPNFAHYNEAVPIELSGVNEDAVSRLLSRIQSQRSSLSRPAAANILHPDLEANSELTKEDEGNTFSKRTKNICVVIASLSGFLSPMSSLAFLPAVPEIADRFNTTGEVINISSAVYCIFMSISPCIFSPCSDIYGRRITFLVCALLFSICTVLVAVSPDLPTFFIFRALTALFGTSFFSIAAHIIGDLFIPEERGTNMSWVISGAQIGTAFGSVLGGIIVNYTSWRVIFWVMAGLGLVMTVTAFVFLPETSRQTKHSILLAEIRKDRPDKKFVFIPFNPLRIIVALKYPNLSIDGFITIAVVYAMYALLTPIRYVVDPRFNLTTPIYSGLFYLAPGMGYLVGSFFGGKWADHVVKKYIRIRGRRVPEDRLRTVLIPLGIVYPSCMLIYGWSIEKEKGGMPVPIIFMFISGIAQTCIFPASNAYCVDCLPELGGDAIGSSYFSRYLAAAVASATCLRSVDLIGVGWTSTISAFVLWIGFGCALVLIYWGEAMRVKSLVKYGLRKEEELVT